ncbi:MAG: homoserine kinase, partial [Melioribacteraceae bacterium]
PGFDIMGFAVNVPVEEMIIRITGKPGIRIIKITGDKNGLPFDINKNTASVALTSFLSALQINIGVEIEIRKRIISGSGLGSSAASAVAAPFALNELLGRPFKKNELLEFAMIGEKAAAGSIHADNVAPCLFGGFILIRGYNPVDLIRIKAPDNLFCTILHPQFAVKTSEARKLIRKNYPLKDVITQSGNAAGLIAGLLKKDYDLIGRSMNDIISEPARAKLIPGFLRIKEAALSAGSIGCSISGSGPAVFAFGRSEIDAVKIGKAMKKISDGYINKNVIYVSKINSSGPEVTG